MTEIHQNQTEKYCCCPGKMQALMTDCFFSYGLSTLCVHQAVRHLSTVVLDAVY